MLSQAPCVTVHLATIGTNMLPAGPDFCMFPPHLQTQLQPMSHKVPSTCKSSRLWSLRWEQHAWLLSCRQCDLSKTRQDVYQVLGKMSSCGEIRLEAQTAAIAPGMAWQLSPWGSMLVWPRCLNGCAVVLLAAGLLCEEAADCTSMPAVFSGQQTGWSL